MQKLQYLNLGMLWMRFIVQLPSPKLVKPMNSAYKYDKNSVYPHFHITFFSKILM